MSVFCFPARKFFRYSTRLISFVDDLEALKDGPEFRKLDNITVYNGVVGLSSVKTVQQKADSAEDCYDVCLSLLRDKCSVYRCVNCTHMLILLFFIDFDDSIGLLLIRLDLIQLP